MTITNSPPLLPTVLTEQDILNRVIAGDFAFDPPLDKYQLQPHSVDLRLGFTFMVPKYWQLTASGREIIQSDYAQTNNNFEVIELEPGQFFEVLPDEYVIFSTLEKIKLPNNIMAVLYPRSSINRRGLSVDLSGVIDANYEGHLIIPVRNNTHTQTIRVYPGERFCQLVFQLLSNPVKPRRKRFHLKDVAFTIGSLKEKDPQEVELIRAGKIRELKASNPLIQ